MPSKEEFYEMIHPEDRDILRQTINTALASGAAYELVIRQKGPGDVYMDVLLRGQPIFDEEGYTRVNLLLWLMGFVHTTNAWAKGGTCT